MGGRGKDPVAIPEWDEGVRHFLAHWISGVIKGLESVDEPARETILRTCGKACAASYTAEIFQDARRQSTDLESFLAALAARFPEAVYERLASGTVRVRYTRCACDLVTSGLVESPLICGCSAYNLQENMTCAWGGPVSVTLERSILEGAPECTFLVSLASRIPEAVSPVPRRPAGHL
jgi:hypothetical protein